MIGHCQLEVVVRKPVENEQTYVWRRIVHTLDLNSIYPDKSPLVDFNVVSSKTSSSANFKRPYSFLLQQGKLFFTTSVDRPAVLRVNVYLNSTLKPTEDLRKFTKVFDIKQDKTQRTHVFELKATGSLDDILKSEKTILNEFETKLWKNSKPCKDCISIAYIRPEEKNFKIGVVSTQRHSDLLDEFCFLGNIPSEYLKIAKLDINRQSIECQTFKTVNQPQSEEYLVNAFLTIGVKPVPTDRGYFPGEQFALWLGNYLG